MQLKVKFLIADDHPQVLEGLLDLISRAPGPVQLSSNGVHTLEANGVHELEANGVHALEANGTGQGRDDAGPNSAPDSHRISLEIVIVRKQLLDAIANIAKGGKSEGQGLNPDGYALVTSTAVRPELSPREKDVLLLIAGGMATKEVAFALNISPKTVDFHRDNIKKKIGLRSAAHLTRFAIENGWA